MHGLSIAAAIGFLLISAAVLYLLPAPLNAIITMVLVALVLMFVCGEQPPDANNRGSIFDD